MTNLPLHRNARKTPLYTWGDKKIFMTLVLVGRAALIYALVRVMMEDF